MTELAANEGDIATPQPAVGAAGASIAAGARLLETAARLRHAPAESVDLEQTRARVFSDLARFPARAVSFGATRTGADASRFAIAALFDDIALNAPWGGPDKWETIAPVASGAAAGEIFFDILDDVIAKGEVRRDELEVFCACLALGFQGKFRGVPRGAWELDRRRDLAHRAARRVSPAFDRRLSSSMSPARTKGGALRAVIPAWVVAAVGAASLSVLFVALRFSIGDAGDAAYARLISVYPARVLTLARPAPPPEAVAVSKPTTLERVRTATRSDVDAGLIEVVESEGRVVVRVIAPNLFTSGSATLAERWGPLLDRTADVLAREPGTLTVVGHTDSQAIRTVRFPSNIQLSAARARAVEDRLARRVADTGRLSSEGRGGDSPIASNDTVDGRERNRRIEILLTPARGDSP